MANQYEADPRQLDAISNYFNPESKTYSDLRASLILAGYSESTAEKFSKSRSKWLQDSTGAITKQKLVDKAKKVLNKSLDSKDEKLAQDTAKFVAKTDVEFSEKVDPNSIVPQTVLVKFIGAEDGNKSSL